MPGERVSMRKIREVLRLRFAQGLSQRAIGISLGLSAGAVNSYPGRARMVGLEWPLGVVQSWVTHTAGLTLPVRMKAP
jgi:hypothetical protein